MSNLDSELIEEKGIDVEPLLQNDQTEGLISRLYSLLASQSRNLQNLSALVLFNFLAAGLFFVTQVKIANVIGKEQFGMLAYAMALGMYGQIIVRYGMDRTLVRDLIHYPNRFAELVMASLLLRGVLLEMQRIAKHGGLVTVLDIPDAAKQPETEAFRRGNMSPAEYERLYANHTHLYYNKDWFSRTIGFSVGIDIFDQKFPGYGNLGYRFNVKIVKD